MIWLELSIIHRALIGCLLTGLLTGLIGVFAVRMRLSSMGFCMSHAAFAGAALGVATAINPLYTAFLFSSSTALLIGPVADKARLHADTITSIAFPFTMALAFIFLAWSPSIGLTSEVGSILWGSILSILTSDIAYMIILSAVSITLIALFWKEFFSIMFNRKLAEADGINTKPFIYFIIFLIGVVVTLSLKLVGGLLIYALLFNPASTALQFLHDMKKILVATPIIGMTTCIAGFILSLISNLPVGSSIVAVSTAIFAMGVILSPKRRRFKSEE
jgi:ABC-type Mn2+/Zn2+ transport system permease subunit